MATVGGALVGMPCFVLSRFLGTTGYHPDSPFTLSQFPIDLLLGAGWGAFFGLVFGPFGYCLALVRYPVGPWLRYSWLPLLAAVLAGVVGAVGALLLVPLLALPGYFASSVVAWGLLREEAPPNPGMQRTRYARR